MSGDPDRSGECGGSVRTSHSGSFRDFISTMKRLERGQTVMFHKPYPPNGSPVAFYLGRLSKQGVLKRRSFPAHTEFQLRKGQHLNQKVRGIV
ncbi:hypothetical protein V1605_27170 (plasmid) [Enterobacter soli]|uniref:hypothetical protein n=1 Tax=Enterobacter TaxID=547 RepID=UPI002235BA59|nr:hypothetical protein [Enterobacter hormaechei]MCW4994403.1 hypothetical protein [Enterobacter hormaechei subsp. xiangfangensis]MCW5045273.1 hypothetical protein [Enterobacter hormaechei subsp. xiangfangensis]